MIKINEVRAERDMFFGGYLFMKNKKYLSRKSKSNKKLLILDDNGRWYTAINYDWAKWYIELKETDRNFTVVETDFLKNYKDLNILVELPKTF